MIKPNTRGGVDYLKSYGFGFTFLSLFNDVRYNTRVSLNGRNIVVVCGYSQRTKMRWISLEASNGDVLLRRTPLTYGRECELDPIARNHDLDFVVKLSLKDKSKAIPEDYDYLNWSKDFRLVFIGLPFTSNRKMKRDLLDYLVGE